MPEISSLNRINNENIKKADLLCKNKDYEGSLILYEEVLKSNPNIPYVQNQSDKLRKLLEIKKRIVDKSSSYAYNKALQLAFKTILNATYGAFANQYFVLSNSKIANAITAMGRDLIRYMVICSENYFYNEWHSDIESHKLLGTEYIALNKKDNKYYFLNKNYEKIDRGYPFFNTGELGDILLTRQINLNRLKKIESIINDFELLYEYHLFDANKIIPIDQNPKWKEDKENGVTFYDGTITLSKYCDTDSCFRDTIIQTNNGSMTIEDLYNKNEKYGSAGNTLKGHESVNCKEKVLNWDNELYYANVKRIIRHKVTKDKWKLKTKSGKEIIVTNDHSMIVFRDGKKIEVKPCDILKTDKILIIRKN